MGGRKSEGAVEGVNGVVEVEVEIG